MKELERQLLTGFFQAASGMHPLNIGIWKTTFLPDFDTKIRNVVVDDAQRMPHRRAV